MKKLCVFFVSLFLAVGLLACPQKNNETTGKKVAPVKKATPTTKKADDKKADVKKADVKKADVKKADVKKADDKKADDKKADDKK